MNNTEIFYENFAGYVFFNKELKAVQATSKGAFSFGEGFRGTANNVIELIKQTNSHTLIIDATKMKIVSAADQEWIIHDWYPRILAAGLKHQAIVVTKDSFSEVSIRKMDDYYTEKQIETVYFYSYREALEWVTMKEGMN